MTPLAIPPSSYQGVDISGREVESEASVQECLRLFVGEPQIGGS